MEPIKICYVDDDIDDYLSNFLMQISKRNDYVYEDIVVTSDDTYDSLVQKIADKRCQIVVLDSKLYNDARVKHKLTGQELELILTDKMPFIFSLVISQNDDIEKYGYIRKYISGREKKDIIKKSFKYYEEQMLTLLDFAVSKCNRHQLCYDKELVSNDSINKMTIENIKSSLDGCMKVMLTKQDIDEIIDRLGEIQEYESKRN